MLSSPCPRCHSGPRAPCAHCPTPSECPEQLGAILSVSPEVLGFIHPIQSRLISLSLRASCSASPGSWPLPSAWAPTLCYPMLGAVMAVPCHREERAGLGEKHTSNTLQGLLLFLLCRSRHSLPSLSFGGPPRA